SAATVEEMWNALAAEGIDADRQQLGYAPHITLAIYPDDSPPDVLRTALQRVVRRWEALPITFGGFGIFRGPPAILWLVPVATPVLFAQHAELQASLPELQAE